MNIVVAACKNRGIGYKNKLPWQLKKELKYFKHLTIGDGKNAVVMGKNTWLGFNKALPKRKNFVLSRKIRKNIGAKDFYFYHNISNVKLSYRNEDIWVIGGGQLYKNMIDSGSVNAIFLTDIKEEFKSDVFFPEISDTFTEIVKSKDYEEDGVKYCMKVFLKNDIPNIYEVSNHCKNKLNMALDKAGYEL